MSKTAASYPHRKSTDSAPGEDEFHGSHFDCTGVPDPLPDFSGSGVSGVRSGGYFDFDRNLCLRTGGRRSADSGHVGDSGSDRQRRQRTVRNYYAPSGNRNTGGDFRKRVPHQKDQDFGGNRSRFRNDGHGGRDAWSQPDYHAAVYGRVQRDGLGSDALYRGL